MKRELLILRHGKSDWDTGDPDFYRPLKARGERSAQRIGTWLQQQNLVPDHVLSSPATRVKMTAQIAWLIGSINQHKPSFSQSREVQETQRQAKKAL